jgi:hypothetical protein
MTAPTTLRPAHAIAPISTHPLTTLLRAAARRTLPPVDGTVAACPAPSGPCAVAIAIGGRAARSPTAQRPRRRAASVPAYDATALRTYLCGGFRAVGAEARFRTGATPTWFS